METLRFAQGDTKEAYATGSIASAKRSWEDTMRAAFVQVPLGVTLKDVEPPKLGAEEVRVRVQMCGVCGTDIHFALDLAVDAPMPLGHEVCGEIAELGVAVREYRIGQRVIVENHTYCGRCAQCKDGNVVHCTTLHKTMHQAGMAETMVAHRSQLHPYEGLSAEAAALAEPLTVALDVTEACDLPLNANVVVFGPGPIGLMAVRLAKLKGARQVTLVGPSHSKARLALGQRLGADAVLHSDKDDIVTEVKKAFPNGVDRCIVTSPPQTILRALRICRFGGIVAFNGIKFGEGSKITFDANEFHFLRLQLRATHSIPNLRFPTAIDLLARGVFRAEDFVTHRLPLSRVAEAMQTAARDKENVIKVMVDCRL
ncbi:MAG: zinc-binding dehydrogenase [Planctomycetes bacterium]|nr:zinc-binding dehydrogenase [Planctomycetota bacterium]MBM4085143.1 zinc-binding dehydrogenase [Planctomycetota bacterium]